MQFCWGFSGFSWNSSCVLLHRIAGNRCVIRTWVCYPLGNQVVHLAFSMLFSGEYGITSLRTLDKYPSENPISWEKSKQRLFCCSILYLKLWCAIAVLHVVPQLWAGHSEPQQHCRWTLDTGNITTNKLDGSLLKMWFQQSHDMHACFRFLLLKVHKNE